MNVPGQAPAMPASQLGRDDEFGQFAPERLIPRIAEGCGCGRIEFEDHSVSVRNDDRVQ